MVSSSPSFLIEILNSPAAMAVVGATVAGILSLFGVWLKDLGQLKSEKNREEKKRRTKNQECLESLYWFSKEIQELYYAVFQNMFRICFLIKSFFDGCQNKTKVEIDRKYRSLQISEFAAAKESFDKICEIIESKQREFISSCNLILNAEEVFNISSLLRQSYEQYSNYAEKTCKLQEQLLSIILEKEEQRQQKIIDNSLEFEPLVNLQPSHIRSASIFKQIFESIFEIINNSIKANQRKTQRKTDNGKKKNGIFS